MDVPNKDLVLSERAALMAEASARITVGAVMEGVVSSVEDFGAFVTLRDHDGQFHGVEGLIHISELSWTRVTAPEQVVQPGQALRVQVRPSGLLVGQYGCKCCKGCWCGAAGASAEWGGWIGVPLVQGTVQSRE